MSIAALGLLLFFTIVDGVGSVRSVGCHYNRIRIASSNNMFHETEDLNRFNDVVVIALVAGIVSVNGTESCIGSINNHLVGVESANGSCRYIENSSKASKLECIYSFNQCLWKMNSLKAIQQFTPNNRVIRINFPLDSAIVVTLRKNRRRIHAALDSRLFSLTPLFMSTFWLKLQPRYLAGYFFQVWHHQHVDVLLLVNLKSIALASVLFQGLIFFERGWCHQHNR